MNSAERQLAELRAARDAARAAFDRQLGRARVDLKPAALKQRVVSDAKVKAMALATEATEIANDSRGVVIATGAALALWLARRPLGRAAAEAWNSWSTRHDQSATETLASAGKRLADRLAMALERASKEIRNDD